MSRARLSIPDRADLAGAWWARIRIRFSHCDPAGIVYFPRYFDLLNGVVEDWFGGALGLSYADFIGPRRIGLGYAHAEADFTRPGVMGDAVDVAVTVARIGVSSLDLVLPAYRGAEALLAARLTIVTTSLVEHRAIPLPQDLREAVTRYRDAAATTPEDLP